MVPGLDVQLVGADNYELAVRFLAEWVCDGAGEARRYLADHTEPAGASLLAARGHDAVGYAAIVWEPDYAGFRRRGFRWCTSLSWPGRSAGRASARC